MWLPPALPVQTELEVDSDSESDPDSDGGGVEEGEYCLLLL